MDIGTAHLVACPHPSMDGRGASHGKRPRPASGESRTGDAEEHLCASPDATGIDALLHRQVRPQQFGRHRTAHGAAGAHQSGRVRPLHTPTDCYPQKPSATQAGESPSQLSATVDGTAATGLVHRNEQRAGTTHRPDGFAPLPLHRSDRPDGLLPHRARPTLCSTASGGAGGRAHLPHPFGGGAASATQSIVHGAHAGNGGVLESLSPGEVR